MNLLRLLLIGLAVWIIVVLIRNRRQQASLKKQRDNHSIDSIVPCRVCGTHVPENEAIREAGKVYCSKEHRDQDRN